MFGYNVGVGMMGASGAPTAVNTIALLHMQGIDGGTSFPDDNTANTWSPNAGVTTSTAQVNFGTSSALLTSTNHPKLTSNDNISLGSGDWTIEMFVYTAFVEADLVDCTGGSNAMAFYFHAGNFHLLYNAFGAAVTLSGVPTSNTWTHIALVKTGTETFKAFVAGTLTDTQTGSATFLDPAVPMVLGGNIGAGYLQGYIDEFRVSKIARYTTSFAPPSAPFVLD